jgi:ABC-2 type transport system ATP-binding protein
MIEAHSLTKRYGDRAAAQDVSFTCEPGTVTGFLGLNGAGKSTTLKMLCGLTPISAGSATVLGAPYSRHPNPGRRIGVLIDASAQHAGRRGREVLAVSAQLLGVDDARVDQLLALVGLDRAAARKRVGQYSLGMRQRLGIAHALLGDPEVLILDEPANGLDPDGMRWMRGLLRDFAQRGGTVLLSSHLLHEIEAIADRLVIIAAGRIVAQGSREDLLTGMSSTLARAADGDALRAALVAAGIEVTTTPDGGVLADAEPDRVGAAALRGGVALRELRADGDSSLEQLFFSLTASGGELHRELEEVAS